MGQRNNQQKQRQNTQLLFHPVLIRISHNLSELELKVFVLKEDRCNSYQFYEMGADAHIHTIAYDE